MNNDQLTIYNGELIMDKIANKTEVFKTSVFDGYKYDGEVILYVGSVPKKYNSYKIIYQDYEKIRPIELSREQMKALVLMINSVLENQR